MGPTDSAAALRRSAIEALQQGRTASQVYDEGGRLEWVSEQMLELAGADSSTEVGIGMELEDGLDLPVWTAMLTDRTREDLRAELAGHLDPDTDQPPVWVAPVELHLAHRTRPVGMLGLTIRGPDGSVAGTALVFAPLLPARVLALVSEGDEAMFTRMADLTEPGRRPTAVLFADIDSSGPLSRRLPTAAYFDLIRRFATVFDDLVARHGGIVGKHAGDGASAFFLAGDAGAGPSGADESAAAHAALAVALALPDAARTIVGDLVEGGVGLAREDFRVNVGVHWGSDLYIGQIVTGGRLEVTALGDEVNECARVEHVAAGGQLLASKPLVERLDHDAATDLGLDPLRLVYRPLAELAADDRKALRDAGTLAVVDLSSHGEGDHPGSGRDEAGPA
ncbi:adenylate/guanylate cyclase domain-containing protein [Actinomycetospora atypica]|uniref:Adenylate/guanylate cyclase domain-containing protein n=1 Tax=Actinomycetospora atypica TaxID=1290095 RepID=A0ABV9YRE7_9PSEU